MRWTYRVFRDNKGHYSVREIFYEQDGKILGYGKEPAAPIGSSLEDLLQQMKWFKEAFNLPVLSTEEVDAQIAAQPVRPETEPEKNIPLKQIKAELALEAEAS